MKLNSDSTKAKILEVFKKSDPHRKVSGKKTTKNVEKLRIVTSIITNIKHQNIMNLRETLQALVEGKKIAYKTWGNGEYFVDSSTLFSILLLTLSALGKS